MTQHPHLFYARKAVLYCLGLATGAGLAWSQLVIPGNVPFNQNALRALGQAEATLVTGAPNLVEGRELNLPSDVAVDPVNKILYVADNSNNRVLAWKNSSGLSTAAPADLVIGQVDKFSTAPGGPNSSFKSGMIAPTCLAVDANGALWVGDGGNNRILRFPAPFSQPTTDAVHADFVIGQSSINTGTTGGRSATALQLSSGSAVYSCAIRFDAGGNLWVTDPLNNRVLRFPAASLGAGKPSGPTADLVLGQSGFTQVIQPTDPTQKLTLYQPNALTFDNEGRLYVADLFNRILVFTPPFASGGTAQRIMGVPPQPAQGQSPLPVVNEYTVGAVISSNVPPEGMFTINDQIFVVDKAANRILRFPPFSAWPLETDSISPAATAVIGQDGLEQTQPLVNRGRAQAGPDSFAIPGKAVYSDGHVYVADTGNNRVLVFGDLSTGGPTSAATTVLGQTDFKYSAQNLVEGREFFNPSGIAIFLAPDGTQQMFVADTNNNRVLGFKDVRNTKPGDKADLVIGQVDFSSVLVNSPSNLITTPNGASLYLPRAVAVDKSGNLWVADTGNGRVLRFSSPFSAGFNGTADLVVGQGGFTSQVNDPSSRTMAAPISLAFSFNGLLAVADAVHNRVLIFTPPFTSGMAASTVVGQTTFTSTAAGTTLDPNKLNQPRGVAIDSDDRLYVADYGNSRVQIFGRVPLLASGPSALFTIRSNQPLAVAVSQLTGEVWTAEPTALVRYPKFDTLSLQGDAPNYQIPMDTAQGTIGNRFLAVTFDPFNNLYAAEATNRITAYYPGLSVCNGASFIGPPGAALAPGMVATISVSNGRGCELGTNFVYTFGQNLSQAFTTVPLPTVLADLKVLVDGNPAPLYYVSDFQINFQVPGANPTTGTSVIQVVQASTGRVFGALRVPLAAYSPSIFTLTYPEGTTTVLAQRQAAVLNQDGTVNSQTNPAQRNQVIQIFGTGVGAIAGMPADGTPATGALPTPARTRVVIGATFVEPGPGIPYSGLAPGLIGVWQVNVVIPDTTPPGLTPMAITLNDVDVLTPPYLYAVSFWVK